LIFEFHRLGRIRLNHFFDAQARLFSCNFLCQVDYDLSYLSTRALLPTTSALSPFSFLVGSCWVYCMRMGSGLMYADRQTDKQQIGLDGLILFLRRFPTI
jgi:hypothetical protein